MRDYSTPVKNSRQQQQLEGLIERHGPQARIVDVVKPKNTRMICRWHGCEEERWTAAPSMEERQYCRQCAEILR